MTQGMELSTSGKSHLQVAVDAALKAGAVLLENFSNDKEITYKGRGNVVTNVDLLAEKALMEHLHAEYPSYSVQSEESEGLKGTSGYKWIIDPLDGSRNYASGMPTYSLTVALVKGDRVCTGVTYDPPRQELFTAEEGKGAYLNGVKLAVSQKPALRWALVGFDMGYRNEAARKALNMVASLWPGMQSLRIMGSAALGLAYVAAGRLDLYFHHNLYPWDLASGLLMIREAGGVITGRNAEPITHEASGVVAAGAAIHADFLHLTEGMEWRQ